MIQVLLVNETRLICNILASALEDEPDITVIGSAITVDEAIAKLKDEIVDVTLVSTRLPNRGALQILQTISDISPETKALVLGLTENKERVLHYVEAGAIGYVLKDDSVDDMIEAIRAAQAGKSLVSPKIAAALMERVAELAQLFANVESGVADTTSLTIREKEVLDLLAQNKTNQEIAEELVIEVGTVKNHVHSILQKLGVRSREEAAIYMAIFRE